MDFPPDDIGQGKYESLLLGDLIEGLEPGRGG